jgi:hypothetical protein
MFLVRKGIIYLLVILMGVFLLSGCLTKEKVDEENGDENSQVVSYSIADIKAEIKDNYVKVLQVGIQQILMLFLLKM